MAELDAGAGGRLDDHFCSMGHCSIHWFRVRWARMSARYAELQFRIGQSQNESESSVASVVFRVRCLDLTSKMLDQFRMCRDTIRAHTRHAYTNHRMHRIQTPRCWHSLRGITPHSQILIHSSFYLTDCLIEGVVLEDLGTLLRFTFDRFTIDLYTSSLGVHVA